MPEYRRLKSFNLTEQDFSNMKNLADSYGVSDAAVIRLGLRKVFEENGLPVEGDSEWYGEDSATEQLAQQVAARVVAALREEKSDG
jgi:antitoxin component of RelBE/YafQ-DinJ toxin-antitoxin module